MKKLFVPLLAALTLLSPAAIADSKEKLIANTDRGLRLAERLCASCHQVGETRKSDAPVGVPSFHALANAPKLTDQRIANTLIAPHNPMPDIQLTRQEIADIIAYIGSLRPGAANKSTKPLKPREKPVYPSQS